MPPRVERQGAGNDRLPLEEPRPAKPQKAPMPRSPQSVVLRMQSEIGNAAVSRLLARSPDTATAEKDTEPPITAPGIAWRRAATPRRPPTPTSTT